MPGQGNSFFQGLRDVKITGLGHILNKAGYTCEYFVGNAKFAGLSDLMEAYGYRVTSQYNCQGQYPQIPHLWNDYDLFTEVKLHLDEVKKHDNYPFAFFLSTTNTHFPHGIYDKRMEKFVSRQEYKMDFSVRAIDYLVEDLIAYLKANRLLENTAVFIFPDHLLPGSTGRVSNILNKKKRQLYLITNTPECELDLKTDQRIFQIDLPEIILSGAGIKTNAKFLRDYINTRKLSEYIDGHLREITSLNLASVNRENYGNGLSIYVDDNDLKIQSGPHITSIPLNSGVTRCELTFNHDMVLLNEDLIHQSNAFVPTDNDRKHNRMHLTVIVDNKNCVAHLGNFKLTGICKEGRIVKFSAEEIVEITNSAKILSAIDPEAQIPLPPASLGPSVMSVTSCANKMMRRCPAMVSTFSEKVPLSRGLNLIRIKEDGKIILEKFDTYGDEKAANSFIKAVTQLRKTRQMWVVAAQDAVRNTWAGYREKLQGIGFKLLPELNNRIAYIGYPDKMGNLIEFSSESVLNRVISTDYSVTIPVVDNER